MGANLEQIRSFWENHVINEQYTRHDRGSRAYFEEIESRRYRYHYHLVDLFKRIEATGTRGMRLLELGCGIGIDTVNLQRLGFAEVVGVDLTESAIAVGRQRAVAEGIDNLTFAVGNGEELEFPEACFDVVYSFGVIHHTAEIARAVAEIHRVLVPGGRMYVMIYHSRSLVSLIHEVFHLPYEEPRNLKDRCPVVLRHTKAQAAALFSAFEEVEIHTDYPFTYGMRMISRLIHVKVQRWLGRAIGWHLMIEARKAA